MPVPVRTKMDLDLSAPGHDSPRLLLTKAMVPYSRLLMFPAPMSLLRGRSLHPFPILRSYVVPVRCVSEYPGLLSPPPPPPPLPPPPHPLELTESTSPRDSPVAVRLFS